MKYLFTINGTIEIGHFKAKKEAKQFLEKLVKHTGRVDDVKVYVV